ncbi:MAG: RNA polymerase sigma-70 factor [Pedobacter sp.]|nr:RNA polymerase sigma-70 factor [Pedobacter sp.]MDQ8054133.1 RNA polymerase sigma-70 factor [Pedobacter sp.]
MSKHTHTIPFEELFKHNYAKLCLFAMQYLKDDEAAKDAVQETFVGLWSKKEELKVEQAAITSYLYTSVRNVCLNKLRRQKLENGFLNDQEPNPVQEESGLNAMIRAEVVAELYQVMTTLPKNCQQIFRMGYLEGLKNPQIAAELGISINTVKTQKKRGLELVRAKLNPEFFIVLLSFIVGIK